jgi:hypothetical protein
MLSLRFVLLCIFLHCLCVGVSSDAAVGATVPQELHRSLAARLEELRGRAEGFMAEVEATKQKYLVPHARTAPNESVVEPSGPPGPPDVFLPPHGGSIPVTPWSSEHVAEPAPYEPAPHEPAPYEPAPHEPAPYEPAPHEPAPYEPAPYEPAPYEPALEVEFEVWGGAPVEHRPTPVVEGPAVDTFFPISAPEEEVPVDDTSNNDNDDNLEEPAAAAEERVEIPGAPVEIIVSDVDPAAVEPVVSEVADVAVVDVAPETGAEAEGAKEEIDAVPVETVQPPVDNEAPAMQTMEQHVEQPPAPASEVEIVADTGTIEADAPMTQDDTEEASKPLVISEAEAEAAVVVNDEKTVSVHEEAVGSEHVGDVPDSFDYINTDAPLETFDAGEQQQQQQEQQQQQQQQQQQEGEGETRRDENESDQTGAQREEIPGTPVDGTSEPRAPAGEDEGVEEVEVKEEEESVGLFGSMFDRVSEMIADISGTEEEDEDEEEFLAAEAAQAEAEAQAEAQAGHDGANDDDDLTQGEGADGEVDSGEVGEHDTYAPPPPLANNRRRARGQGPQIVQPRRREPRTSTARQKRLERQQELARKYGRNNGNN